MPIGEASLEWSTRLGWFFKVLTTLGHPVDAGRKQNSKNPPVTMQHSKLHRLPRQTSEANPDGRCWLSTGFVDVQCVLN
jgi:hypothetical protein